MSPSDWAGSDVALGTVVCASALGGLAVVSLAVHVTERRRAGSFRWPADSLTFVTSALTAVLLNQTLRAAVYGGLGRHVSDVSAETLAATIKVTCLPITEQQRPRNDLVWAVVGLMTAR